MLFSRWSKERKSVVWHRNKINAEEVKLDVDGVVLTARRSAMEYEQFCVPASKTQNRPQQVWKPPDDECLKSKY
jgi:hypothetical protein